MIKSPEGLDILQGGGGKHGTKDQSTAKDVLHLLFAVIAASVDEAIFSKGKTVNPNSQYASCNAPTLSFFQSYYQAMGNRMYVVKIVIQDNSRNPDPKAVGASHRRVLDRAKVN